MIDFSRNSKELEILKKSVLMQLYNYLARFPNCYKAALCAISEALPNSHKV